MKLFTLSEANDLLPEVKKKLLAIQKHYANIARLRDSARAAATVSNFGGGMEGGSSYVKTLYEAGKLTTEIHEMGIQLKDYTRGLIDFPTMRDGRIVFLCWEISDGDEILWYHETESGFAGRRPLY